jgi:hypothetical protein
MSTPTLALIPTGYKAGKLYSVLPESGVGDFTVVRATDATRVNEEGLIETMGANVPRLDYSGGGCPVLLTEPQRTNLITYSDSFGSTGWALGSTGLGSNPIVTSNQAISPDGTLNADRVVFNVGGGNTSGDRSLLRQNISVTSDDYSLSFWAKSNDGSSHTLNFNFLGSLRDPFVVTSEWQRFEYTSIGISGSGFFGLELSGITQSSNADILIWGAQLEQGSYATSLINTQGSAVTRVQDVCSQTPPSGIIGQTQGTIFIDVDFKTLSGTNMFVSIRPDANNKIEIYRSGAVIYGEFASNASFNFNKPSVTVGRYKIAVAYSSGSSAMYINGVLIGSNTTPFAFTSTLDGIYINSRGTTFIEQSSYNDVRLYSTRLSNNELAALTQV